MLRYPDHTRSIISSICPPRQGGGLLEGEVECEEMGYLLGIAKKCEGCVDGNPRASINYNIGLEFTEKLTIWGETRIRLNSLKLIT